MLGRRLVGVAPCFGKTGFDLDGAQRRGLVRDAVFEPGKALDAGLATPAGLPLRVVSVPVARTRWRRPSSRGPRLGRSPT